MKIKDCFKYNQHRGIVTEVFDNGKSVRLTCPGGRKGQYDIFTYIGHPRTKQITEKELLDFARKTGCTAFFMQFQRN